MDNEIVVCFDVDDTLVMWDSDFERPRKGTIQFVDPYDNSVNYLKPHKKHIALLKKYKGRGFYIRVWSHGGVKWALSVIKTLGLEDFVDSVETKPDRYIDDLEAKDVLGVRVYLKYED